MSNKNKNKPVDDPVNHPAHYTDGKIEVIDFIDDKGSTSTAATLSSISPAPERKAKTQRSKISRRLRGTLTTK